MALGTFTLLEQSAGQGPLFIDRVSVVGDGTYPAGGTPTFEAVYQDALAAAGLNARTIVALIDDEINADDGSGTSDGIVLKYDHSADKLAVFLGKTMVESAQANQSSVTYLFTIVSK